MNDGFGGVSSGGPFGAWGKAPKSFLTPYLLLLLRQWNAHGYQLLQQLLAFGFAAIDPATVYRTLRQLEKDGLVNSRWDTGHDGPARRVYTITDAGVDFLQTWANSLDHYRQALDRFFDLYAGATAPAPKADPPATAESAEPPKRRSTRRAPQGENA